MTDKHFDPCCGALADHFLPFDTREMRDKLAQYIQDEIEDWLDQHDDDLTPSASHDDPT